MNKNTKLRQWANLYGAWPLILVGISAWTLTILHSTDSLARTSGVNWWSSLRVVCIEHGIYAIALGLILYMGNFIQRHLKP